MATSSGAIRTIGPSRVSRVVSTHGHLVQTIDSMQAALRFPWLSSCNIDDQPQSCDRGQEGTRVLGQRMEPPCVDDPCAAVADEEEEEKGHYRKG